MDKLKLFELIAGGEDNFTEFKRDTSQRSDFAAEMVAFANVEGGKIFVGVEDDGTIVGIPDPHMTERAIIDIARNNCVPSMNPSINWVDTDRGIVFVVNVSIRTGPPYENNSGQCHIRVGTTKRLCSPQERARLLQSSGLMHVDEIPIQETAISDLDNDSFASYYQKVFDQPLNNADMPLDRMLSNMRFLVVDRAGYQRLSLAGLLLFGKSPQEHLYNARISAVRWNGNEPGDEIIDRQEITGRLPNQIEQAEAFLLRNIRLSTKIDQFKQTDEYEYPRVALREAVVNAVAHRDYSLDGAQILLFIFNDRVEIRSPGKLPNSVTLENIRTHYSKLRNETIARVLFNLGFVNTLGSGIPRMIRLMKEHTGREPDFEINDPQFIVKLWAA